MERRNGTAERTLDRSTMMERRNGLRFDEATKLLAGEASNRRAALQLLGSGALGTALIGFGLSETVAKKGKGKGKGKGKRKGKGTGAGQPNDAGPAIVVEPFCIGDLCFNPSGPLTELPPGAVKPPPLPQQ